MDANIIKRHVSHGACIMEPRLYFVSCPGAARGGADTHRMAYWEWNQTGDPHHPHVLLCVHGLTRQGRDFNVVARALSPHMRVICPDVVGRGESDWLADPMAYGVPQYLQDMLVLLAHVQQAAPVQRLDWLGTSMGGLIGMAFAATMAQQPLYPLQRLLLNDVGPQLEWPALQRIASYVGKDMEFASAEQAVAHLQLVSAGFGPHTPQQWQALSAPMLRSLPQGGVRLHYDPAIAQPMQHMDLDQTQVHTAALWQLYELMQVQTLLVRGAHSDLITAQTAQAMAQRGPQAKVITLEGVGHAPTFVGDDQLAIVQAFFLGDE